MVADHVGDCMVSIPSLTVTYQVYSVLGERPDSDVEAVSPLGTLSSLPISLSSEAS